MRTERHERRVPVTLLTGFLGSGKTTLLNTILRDPAMAGSAVLINEVGEVGLDHLLVEQVSEEITLLESGCLCCAVRGDLVKALRDLFMRRLRREIPALDRVIIETTGLADPAPVIHTLVEDFFLAERYVLEGVVSTLDVRNVHWQTTQHAEARRQIVLADRIVFTKCDLASETDIAFAEARVEELNPSVNCWRSTPGSVPEGLLSGLSPYRLDAQPAEAIAWLGEVRAAEQARLQAGRGVFGQRKAAPLAIHSESVQTHVLRFEQPFEWPAFAQAIDTLLSVVGNAILRVKGLVAVAGEDAPRVLHAVQHERYPGHSLTAWPDEDHSTRLVFIVDDLPRSVIEKAFSAFCGQAHSA
ncbi:GTP-binding protein [Viridibacterium curvum]|uniref:GTP-binding protein n=1 Tax=Viridibacterium curvum TaxID=1101404 RepID=A0ABP9QMS6_9RHOO